MHRFCRFALVFLPALLAGCGGDDDYTLPTDAAAGPPSLTSVTMSHSDGGDTTVQVCGADKTYDNRMVSVQVTASETILPPTVLIAGVVATEVDGSGTTWTASRELRPGDIEGPVSVRVIYRDLVGNAGEEATVLTSGTPYTWEVPGGQYMTCWADEFDDDDGLDLDLWSIQTGDGSGRDGPGPGWGRGELQTYVSDMVAVKDGKLVITADQGAMPGEYRSARISSKQGFHRDGMRVEVRAKLPQGQGLRPAIWMRPADPDGAADEEDAYGNGAYGPWPQSGQIDIVDAINLGTGSPPRQTIASAIHYGFPEPVNSSNIQEYELPSSADGFHTYAMEWERFSDSEAEIRFYVDGVHYATQNQAGWFAFGRDANHGYVEEGPLAPFDQAFHLMLNVAVGGDRPGPGAPDVNTSFPQTMEVDWVRVSECAYSFQATSCSTDKSDDVDPASGADRPNTYTLNIYDGEEVEELDFRVARMDYKNTLQVDNFPPDPEPPEMNMVVTMNDRDAMDPDDEDNSVWRLQIMGGVGNAYVGSADLSAHEVLDSGFDLRGFRDSGELLFDMYIGTLSEGTSLVVKMDSVWPHLGQVPLELPTDDAGMLVTEEWRTYRIPVSALLANPFTEFDGQGLNLANVNNLFVIEAVHADAPEMVMADVYLDNIRLVAGCPGNTSCEPKNRVKRPGELVVFDDSLGSRWGTFSAFDEAIGYSSCTDDGGEGCPSISWSIVEAFDASRGRVLEVTYPPNAMYAGLVVGGPVAAMDLSAYDEGTLRFDLLVTAYPGGANDPKTIKVKVDCEDCPSDGMGEREVTLPMPKPTAMTMEMQPDGGEDGEEPTMMPMAPMLPIGEWTEQAVSISDMTKTAGPLQTDKVTTGMVIFPPFGMTAGVSFQLDNVRWTTEGGTGAGGGGGRGAGVGLVYDDAVNAQWTTYKLGAFDQARTPAWSTCEDDAGASCPSVSWSEVSAAGRGTVLQVTYAADAQFAGVVVGKEDPGLDFSSFAGGTLKFDIMVTANPMGANFIAKADCVGCPSDGNGEREVSLGMPTLNTWQTLTVNVDDMVNSAMGPLQLDKVTTGLVVFPESGKTAGVVYQLDDVRWEPAASP